MTITSIADIIRTHGPGQARRARPRIRRPDDHLRRARPALDPARERARGVGVGAQRPRRVPRQELPRVLRGHLRARQAQRGQRRGELAARAGRDGAHHQRRPGQGARRRPRLRRARREDRSRDRDRATIVAIGGHARWPDYETVARRQPTRRSGRGAGRRRRRVPALHVGHDRSAQGRDADQRQLLQGHVKRHRIVALRRPTR